MIPLQPWMLKAGAGVLFLSLIFYSGCYVQKKVDSTKILKLKTEINRDVEIIEAYQENYDALDQAIKDQNNAIEALGEATKAKIEQLNKAHAHTIAKMEEDRISIIKQAKEEQLALLDRMKDLSVGEACHEAMVELVK